MKNLKVERTYPSLTVLGLIVVVGGICFGVFAQEVLQRFSRLEGTPTDRLWLMRGFGLGTITVGLAIILECQRRPSAIGRAALAVVAIGSFLSFTQQFSNWWIDDSGITFSYSRSLMEGAGVTYNPGSEPTEGYSSTVWMTFLATFGLLGFDIPNTAKTVGIFCGVLIIIGAMRVAWKETHSPMAMALTAAGLGVAPFVVWSASGQEHALQALLLFLVFYSAVFSKVWRRWATLLLSILVLTRPETPIIVVAVFSTLFILSWRSDGVRAAIRENLAIALVPFLVFCALITWRILYFGDPLPNPFYAKASSSTFSGLLNPFGGGWRYVLGGLLASALIALIPLYFFRPQPKTKTASVLVLFALICGHLFFVIWAKGDWMGQYRFLMPVIPLLVLACVPAFRAVDGPTRRAGLGGALSLVLLSTSVLELDRFASRPTTPLSIVSYVGQTFADLSDRLAIVDPLLAHHDAGAISYERSIGLLDLGGLVDREVAKNMTNRPFLENYVFIERQPDFIFGAINFAAASGFTQAPEFSRDYVPLVFENDPMMSSSLSHIRRELARDADGVSVERDINGDAVRVIFKRD